MVFSFLTLIDLVAKVAPKIAGLLGPNNKWGKLLAQAAPAIANGLASFTEIMDVLDAAKKAGTGLSDADQSKIRRLVSVSDANFDAALVDAMEQLAIEEGLIEAPVEPEPEAPTLDEVEAPAIEESATEAPTVEEPAPEEVVEAPAGAEDLSEPDAVEEAAPDEPTPPAEEVTPPPSDHADEEDA